MTARRRNSLATESSTGNVKRAIAELELLRGLCNTAADPERRIELARILDGYLFSEPEHQVIFESARDLLMRGILSPARLGLLLNKRGFPDVDLDQYFAAGPSEIEGSLKQARQLRSLAQQRGGIPESKA